MTDPDGSRTTRVRLALLDDHEVLLDSIADWIRANEPAFEVVVTASNWIDLVHSPAFPTELVLMDLQLSEPVSIEARVRTCRAAGATVMVLTALDTQRDRARALEAGAVAYLAKTQPIRDVMSVARSVMGIDDGGFAPSSPGEAGESNAAVFVRPNLSLGERSALMLYANGKTTTDVAAAMNVQYETAKTYLRRVREKYGRAGRPTSSRADLIRRAAEDGYLT